jgi:hypothetical protein
MRLSAAVLAVAALAMTGQALAQSSPADGAVSTAPAQGGGAPLSTGQQIDQYLATSPVASAARNRDEPEDIAVRDGQGEGRMRGEVSVGVGTGGYRSGSVSAVIPLGETGTLGLSLSRTENGFGYLGDGRPGYGYGYDGLSAPQTPGTICGADGREPGERGWYSQPDLTGRSPAGSEQCPNR